MVEWQPMPPQKNSALEELALGFTRWVGSIQSIVVHTLFFVASFAAVAFDLVTFDRMLLVLTTVVSLEAIYLAIFIQMSLNLTRASLAEVEQDIDEIQEDVGEIQEDVDEIQQDVDEIQEDVDEIQEEMVEEDNKTPHA
jgi:peptidoglycan hydrolase CwlO-like protein